MILLSYDGSADADAAIDRAASLLPGTATTVLTVWEPYLDVLARSGGVGFGMTGSYAGSESIDASTEQAARDTATRGADRARAAGLDAEPRVSRRPGSIAEAILNAGDDLDAEVIVLGNRGLGSVKSLLLGSVSHAVVQHADRAVLVVPAPDDARERRDHRTKATAAA